MSAYEAKVRDLLDAVVAQAGMELIHVECVPMKSRWVVRLFLDKVGGVTLDDCALISGIAGDILGVHDVPPGAYTLEVSSPGPERPVSRTGDFEKYIGAEISLRLTTKIEGRRNIVGTLRGLSADKNAVLVDMGGVEYAVSWGNLARANLRENTGKDGQ